MDVFPTLLDLTAKIDLSVDGISLLQVLDANESGEKRAICWESEKAKSPTPPTHSIGHGL